MKFKLIYTFLLTLLLFSCKNENVTREAEAQRDAQKRELILSNINKAWVFNGKPSNETSRSHTLGWKEWAAFLAELDKKPAKNIGAYQKKAKALSQKAIALNNNIPIDFNIPPIKSRISALITKIEMMDLYLHLNDIPDKKVSVLVGEINAELTSLQDQMDIIVRRNKIPLEEGESELLRMLDTSRAIPNAQPDRNIPRVE